MKEDFSSLLSHIAPQITLNDEEEKTIGFSPEDKEVKRKEFVERPGVVSKYRTYVVEGAIRAYVTGDDGQEHTIFSGRGRLVDRRPRQFLFPGTSNAVCEAIEDTTIIQWSHESEALAIGKNTWICNGDDAKMAAYGDNDTTTGSLQFKPFCRGALRGVRH